MRKQEIVQAENYPVGFPIWQCLPLKTVVLLVEYQWEHFGTKLEFMLKTPYREIEGLEEISKLLTQKPHYPVSFYSQRS